MLLTYFLVELKGYRYFLTYQRGTTGKLKYLPRYLKDSPDLTVGTVLLLTNILVHIEESEMKTF